ncbi:MAG: phenylalanine--tRNA ligase subunit alpha, partial [Methanothermobacter tenebrarum]
MMDVERIIDELHLYEKKVLKALEKLEPPVSPDDIVKSQNMDIKAVMSAIGSLESKGLVSVHKSVDKLLKPTRTGREYATKGLPERRILQLLSKEGPLKVSDIMEKSGLDKTEAKVGIGWLMRKKWATIKDNILRITSEGEKSLERLGFDEILLQKLAEKGRIRVSSLSDELKEAFKLLNQRKGLLEVKKVKEHRISLTDKGRAILERGFEIREEATQLTHEDLKTGRWRKLYYRGYDIHAEYPIIFPGKMHPLKRIIEEIRDIFLKMGFTEARGPIIESAFWNFDCLF